MSGKTTAEKLRIKPNATVWVWPEGRAELIAPLPEGARTLEHPDSPGSAVVFVQDAAELRSALAEHHATLHAADVLWIAYPKGNKADLNRDTLWPIAAEHDLRPIGQVAIDATWSAMRFRPLEPGEPPFEGGRR